MSDSITVRVTLDSYDMASTGRQTQVYVQIPEVARASWLLPSDLFHGLKDRAWPEVLDVAHDYVTYGGVASNSASTAAWAAVREWLAEDANRDEMQAAYELDEARRHPVARKLLADNERLRARLDDVHRTPQDQLTPAEVRLGQYAQPPRTFASDTERALFQIACGLRDTLEEVRDQRNSARLKVMGLEARVAELEAEREKLVRWHGEDSKTITGLVARVDRRQAELVALRNDALSMRGSLVPASGDRKVPFELGETLTPAVDWLIARVAELEAAPTTVYRAEHPDSGITLGHYGTETAARAHCEAEERRAWPTGTTLAFGWIRDALPEDDENGIAELVVTAGQNEESTTGYIVTALELDSEYDPDGDE